MIAAYFHPMGRATGAWPGEFAERQSKDGKPYSGRVRSLGWAATLKP